MKIVLHIFKKDARHLWPQIAVTQAMLAALGREDRWRSDWLAGQTEGWLNLLLPLVWVFLIGLAVGQEPLTGHRQFWITRPYRRSGLVSAKLLFALAFVHVPFFLEQAYVLAARGFSPVAHLPDLLWNQMLLLAGLTLPAIALAALASTFTHFVMEVGVVCAGAIFLKSTFYSSPMPWQRVDTVRIGVTLGILSVGSLAIAWMQYFGRRVKLSRGVAMAAGVAAGALFAAILPRTAFAVRSAFAPIREQVSFSVDASPSRWTGGAPNRSSVAIPVTISGLVGPEFHLEGLGMRIKTQTGTSYQAPARPSYQSFDKVAFFGYLSQKLNDRDHAWLFLRLDPSLFRELRDSDIEIRGDAGITAYRLGETRWMPAVGAVRTLLGGACTGIVVEGRWAEDMLKLECESPAAISVPTRVRLWDPQSGRDWKQSLGDSAPYSTGPRSTWFSALDRRQTFFRLTDHADQPGSQWLVPRAVLASAKIGITPEIVTGYRIVPYRLTGVRLGQYWVPPQQ